MSYKFWQRCIASLIVLFTVVGVLAPTTVFARPDMTGSNKTIKKITKEEDLLTIVGGAADAKYTTEFYWIFWGANTEITDTTVFENFWKSYGEDEVGYDITKRNPSPISFFLSLLQVKANEGDSKYTKYLSQSKAESFKPLSSDSVFTSDDATGIPKYYRNLVDWLLDNDAGVKTSVYNCCASNKSNVAEVSVAGKTKTFTYPKPDAKDSWMKNEDTFYKHFANTDTGAEKKKKPSAKPTNKPSGRPHDTGDVNKGAEKYEPFSIEGLTSAAHIYELKNGKDRYAFVEMSIGNNKTAYANLARIKNNSEVKIGIRPANIEGHDWQLKEVPPMTLYTSTYDTGALANWKEINEHYTKTMLDDSGTMTADVSNLGARMALFLSAINEATVQDVNRTGIVDWYGSDEEKTLRREHCTSITDINDLLALCLTATIDKSDEIDDLFTMRKLLGLSSGSDTIGVDQFKDNDLFGGALGIINQEVCLDPSKKGNHDGLWGTYVHPNGQLDFKFSKAIPTDDTVTVDSGLRLSGVAGAELCVAEYANPLATGWISTITKDDGWKSDKGIQGTIVHLNAFYKAYGEIVPLVKTIYTTKDSKCNKSYEDLFNEAGLDGTSVNDVDPKLENQNTYQVNYDKSTPIGDFYVLNGSTGITSYDRDKILGDVNVNTAYDEMNESDVEQNDRDNTYEGYNIHESDNTLSEEDASLIGNSGITSVQQQIANSKLKDSTAWGIDETGLSTSNESVTMSDYIVKGMAYSTTYMPMRTNLYSAETIKRFDEDFLNDFYYKYGFMRKALMIDQSATSAMDYYNSNGQSTGQLRVVTLRDLIENDGSDVTLYIDDNFYNSKQIIEQVPKVFDAKRKRYEQLISDLNAYIDAWKSNTKSLGEKGLSWFTGTMTKIGSAILDWFGSSSEGTEEDPTDYEKALESMDWSEIRDIFGERMLDTYDVDINAWAEKDDAQEYVDNLEVANSNSEGYVLDNHLLKNGDETTYDDLARGIISESDGGYTNLSADDHSEQDNSDTIVLTSRQIKRYMSMTVTHSEERVDESNGEQEVYNEYTTLEDYSPMVSFAFISCLYRNGDLYTLANTVANSNPVFMASDDLCGVHRANQWYRNSLLNYAFMRNLKSAAQIDYAYCVDLDCPLYMDVFGNILTESGTVVVPAASNATLHTGAFKNFNVAMGFYAIYGHDYSIPLDVTGAYSVCNPYLIADLNADHFTLNGVQLTLDNTYKVNLSRIDNYDDDVLKAVQEIYLNSIVVSDTTVLNWMAMVNISNEVMRGAPIEYIDKSDENLYTDSMRDKSAAAAAVKFEGLLDSLRSQISNTLVAIPDFSRIDGMEFYVALFIKLLMAATSAVIIIFIYRDATAATLSWRTAWQSLSAIALTVAVLVSVPAVFQLTYYGANKLLLEDESIRILMVNTEKNECGVEIGMTETREPKLSDNFSIQLDFIQVPWYKQLGAIMDNTSREALQRAKLEAYRETPMYNNSDVTVYNDGVYITAGDLFETAQIDYNFANSDVGDRMYLRGDGGPQTASFYSPYYVFLKALVKDVNYYNENVTESSNYTTKYVAGTRLKTVGLCNNYFTSKLFMEETGNYFFLKDIYGVQNVTTECPFTDEQISAMHNSLWYNSDLERVLHDDVPPSSWDVAKKEKNIDGSRKYYTEAIYNAKRNEYYDFYESLDKRIEAMDEYARQFISKNKDMLTKVTDETFLKCFALCMAIKYNQLFGVNAANSLEIYNLDSNDLLRLCIAKSDEAVMTTPMSYARYVYNFAGESGIYAATILEIIMWAGSFLKPLCTVIVFISLFASLWVFKVLLRRKSNNIVGYLVTMLLLCGTNFLHSLILKIGVNLPSMGLSGLACLIFMIVGQVLYLLVLAYVTGVSLRDWANLGATEYEKEAAYLSAKFKKNNTSAVLSGRVKHYDNNWDYYDDLINQHRSRNIT